jgi:hypothetical protein
MSNVVMNYSPNDFFYVKFDEENGKSTINNSICDPLKPYDGWDTNCNISNYNSSSTNKINCNLKELCKNKEKVEYLQSIQNIHNGSDQNYLDTKASYNTALLRTFNLGIGIFIIIGLIYRNRNI